MPRTIVKRRFRSWLASLALTSATAVIVAWASDPSSLPVVHGGDPRVFSLHPFLKVRAGISYADWEACFSRLMGIESKALDEENPSSQYKDFLVRFKRQHPDQLMMLHYNGDARDPRDQSERFFPGHWLYYNGAVIGQDAPAELGESVIAVDHPELFRTSIGRYRNANDDIGLCELDAAGRPDWSRSEQVQLIAVDLKERTIRVHRASYGTKPRSFGAGHSYAAAHVTEGPWGPGLHLLWFYNYSTLCPRDAAGHNGGEAFSTELAAHFLPGGDLANFDGLEFDETYHELPSPYTRGNRAPDFTGEGTVRGSATGLNTYGIGVYEFFQLLRKRLGPQRLILADGEESISQRGFGVLNGIESEGWPANIDPQIRDWSGGMNRQLYWSQHSFPPAFSYINHKFVIPGAQLRQADVPMEVHRLVFAVAMFTDSAICYLYSPPKAADEPYGIWDELRKGTERQLAWLGGPLGPGIRIAERHPDVLGLHSSADLIERLRGTGVAFSKDGNSVKVVAADPDARDLRFRLTAVPCDGADLTISVTMRGEPMRGYPPDIARLAWAELPGSGTNPENATRFMTFVGKDDFRSRFYFKAIASKATDVEFTIEGREPVWISMAHAYHSPDAILREFEHGAVLANPSPRPYALDLTQFIPGAKFRRLRGSPEQDPITNDGSPVVGPLLLRPKEGLFLVRQ